MELKPYILTRKHLEKKPKYRCSQARVVRFEKSVYKYTIKHNPKGSLAEFLITLITSN